MALNKLGERPRRRQPRSAAPLAATLASAGLLIAACGGGASPSSVASLGKGTVTTVSGAGAAGTTPNNFADEAKHYAQALKYSRCMRSHGLSDFPDPGAGGGIQLSGGPNSDLNPSDPTFVAAQNACQKYLPFGKPSAAQQAHAEQQALKFAACMRKNGVPNFPDPQVLSGGRIGERIPTGAEPNSPPFLAAQQKCSNSSGP